MRTAAQLKKTIRSNNMLLKKHLRLGTEKTADAKRLVKTNEVLKSLMQYLETKPKEKFILSEKNRIKKLIKNKNENFHYWCNYVCIEDFSHQKKRRLFNKENGIAKLRTQLKNLNYLLNENQEQPAFR